jgi:hypothetical protein
MSANTEKEMLFLRDLSALLIEQASAAKADFAKKTKEGAPCAFESGQVTAFYSVLSLVEQQAAAFAFSKEEVGLAGFDSESLLRE